MPSQSALSKQSTLEPAVYTMADTARLFGYSYSAFNELVRSGLAPVDPIRVGRTYRFPKRAIDRLLGLNDDADPDVS